MTYCQRGADAFLEKGFIRHDAVGGEEADVDLGLGIEQAHAEQALAVVFDLDQIAIGDGMGKAEDFVVVNPRVAGDDAIGFTGPEQDSR